jgi:hypothetical protein
MRIQLIEQLHFFGSVIAPIPNVPPHYCPVLFFHEAVVILPMRSGSGEADLLPDTVAIQLVVDELAAVI